MTNSTRLDAVDESVDPAIPVRLQVGRVKARKVGWIVNPEALPDLLRAVADEIEYLQRQS
jgi:hypothetical protein